MDFAGEMAAVAASNSCSITAQRGTLVKLRGGYWSNKARKGPRLVAELCPQSQQTEVYLILLVLWKNGSGFGACTPINPKICRSIRGWPLGPQEKKRSTKRSRSLLLVPSSAFVSIRDIRSARFSTAPHISLTKSGGMQGHGG